MQDDISPSTPDGSVSKADLHRAIAASAIGNATEWFDYGIYAYGVTFISAAMFPGETGDAILFALATFAISFLVRPLGGLFWGPLGDRLGRKSVLAMTIILMSGATFCVGLIPSYDSIGLLAPLLLIFLRMVQGFSTGGEYGGAATFMAEYAPDESRGFYGSFLEFGTLAGFSAGAALMLSFDLALGSEAMSAWGWRLPFLVAAPLGLIGLYMRSRIEDTPVFREIERRGEREAGPETEFRDLIYKYWKPLLTMSGMVIALNVVNYTLLSYMPTYFQARLGLSTDQALIVPLVGMVFMMMFVPFAGILSDKIGRKPLWWASLVGLIIAVVPCYHLMATGFLGATIGFAILGLLYVPQLATISSTFPAMLPTPVRFAGLAIAYNVATSLFGGSAPALSSWLVQSTGNLLAPAYLMMAACGVGLVSVWFLIETAGASIRGTEIPGTQASRREVEMLRRTQRESAA